MATLDKDAVREVVLFQENDYDTYRALMDIYLPNLTKKRMAGKYDKKLSYKLLEYYYSNYVRPNMKKPQKYGIDPKLGVAERKAFAKEIGDQLWDEHIKSVKVKSKMKTIPKSKRKLKPVAKKKKAIKKKKK